MNRCDDCCGREKPGHHEEEARKYAAEPRISWSARCDDKLLIVRSREHQKPDCSDGHQCLSAWRGACLMDEGRPRMEVHSQAVRCDKRMQKRDVHSQQAAREERCGHAEVDGGHDQQRRGDHRQCMGCRQSRRDKHGDTAMDLGGQHAGHPDEREERNELAHDGTVTLTQHVPDEFASPPERWCGQREREHAQCGDDRIQTPRHTGMECHFAGAEQECDTVACRDEQCGHVNRPEITLQHFRLHGLPIHARLHQGRENTRGRRWPRRRRQAMSAARAARVRGGDRESTASGDA